MSSAGFLGLSGIRERRGEAGIVVIYVGKRKIASYFVDTYAMYMATLDTHSATCIRIL